MPNNFSDAIETNGALDMTKLRASLWSSSSENPEQATKQLSIARDLKVPVEAVKADPEELKRQKAYEALDFDAILRDSPNLANTLQDTNKSAALHDDIIDLSKYESNVLRDPNLSDYAADLPAGALKATGSSLSGWAELDRSWRRFGIRMYDKFGIEHSLYKNADIYSNSDRYAKLLSRAGESIKRTGDSLTDPNVELTTGRQIAQGVGQIGPQIATALISPPLAVASFTGQGADVMSDVVKEKGQYGTPQGDLATVGGAAVTGITEKLGVDLLLGKLPPSIKQGIASNLVKAFEKIGLQNATLKAVATVGGTIALKAAGEATQEATEQTLQNKITQFLLDPTVKTFEGVGQSAKVGGGVGATVASILQLIAGRKNKVKTITNPSTPEEANINYNIEQTTIAEHVKQIQENKTFQRDPQLFSDVHESTLGQKEVYVNAEKINEYFQKLGDDGSQLELFLESMPKAKEQYAEALSLGGDMILPANEVLVKLAQQNNPELNALVKLSPTSMTNEDYTAHLDNRITPEFESSAANQEQTTQREAYVQQFYDKYKEGTKFDKAAQHNAEIMASFIMKHKSEYENNPDWVKKLEEAVFNVTAQKGTVNLEGALNQVIKVPLNDNSGLETLVHRDPTPGQVGVQFRRSKKKELRWFKDREGNLYTWDSYDSTHEDMISYFGVQTIDTDLNGDILPDSNLESGIFHSEQEANDFVKSHMKDKTKSYNQSISPAIFWHGSASGDLRGGTSGLHLGTKLAATQALQARIGVPAEGEWDGTREYGKTLLAGKKTLKRIEKETGQYVVNGYNVDAPEEDYYPTQKIKYADGTEMPYTVKPAVKSYRLKGGMSNSPQNPHDDFKANGYMKANLKKGKTKNGFYYKNISEDEGSISIVVPNGSHVESVDSQTYNQSVSPAFYSTLEKTITDSKQTKATPEQWLNTIKNTQGIKEEELADTGLTQFLQDKKGQVSKQEILDHLLENQVQIEEVLKEDEQLGLTKAEQTELEDLQDYISEEGEDNVSDKELSRYHELIDKQVENISHPTNTKYEEYQLHGGKNYKEILLTLPTNISSIGKIEQLPNGQFSVKSTKEPTKIFKTEKEAIAETKRLGEKYNIDKTSNFSSTHYNEKNILAHIRFNERTDVEGNKVLFIEEIQSDWHQAGRDKGYKTGEKVPVTNFMTWVKSKGISDTVAQEIFDSKGMRGKTPDGTPAWNIWVEWNEFRLDEGQRASKENKAVPNAPFKKSWQDLAMKKMLRYAVDNGFDKIAWTTGEQQIQRYESGLRKAVDEIQYSKDADGKFTIKPIKDGNTLSGYPKSGQTVSQLQAELGKDIANKIVEGNNSLSESVAAEQVKQLEVATTKALETLNKADKKVQTLRDKFKEALRARGGVFDSIDEVTYQKDYGRMKEFKAWKAAGLQRDKVEKVYIKLSNDKETSKLNTKNVGSLKGKDLKVGGTFMRSLYDTKLVNFIDKYTKKFGTQVKDGLVNAGTNTTEPAHTLQITPELASFIQQGQPLYQKANEEVRGSVLFQKLNGSIKSIISLFEKENKSTLLHESAHVFLEIYKTLAEDPDAPKEFVDEFNAIRAELGLKPGEEIQTKHHEMWARAFEQYVRTGKAPSIELQSTFQTFKSWLVRIYKSALELNVKVSPELSVLFDRMLATDEQIEMMRNSSLFRPDPNISKLLTKAEQADYVRRNEKVLEAAKEHLLRKAIKQKEREKKAEWNTQRESIKKEITTQVQQEPVQQAMHFLKKGTLLGKETPKEIIPLKLSRSDVKSKLSDEDFKRISAGILSSDGVPTEVISDMFGFKDAQDMLAQIKDAPSFKDRVNQLTDEEMTRRNGDMLNDGSIEQEALASLHSADRADFINYEIGVLSRKANQLQATKEEIKAKAIALINKTPINKLRPDLFYNAEVRAAREVGNALAKKNYIKAADEKGKQLLNHYAYRAALEAKKNLIRSEKLFKKVFGNDAKIASLRNIDMVEAARSLLSKFGYGKADISQLNRFLKTIEDNPQFFERLAPVEAANEIVQQDYDKMTPDDLNTLLEGVQNLWHLARQDKQIEIDGKKVAKDQAVAELKEQFVKTSTIREHGKKHAVRKKESMTMVGLSLLAALRRVESWVSKVDGVKFLGPVRRYIYTPISEACNQYRLVRQETLIKYRQILAPVEKTLTNKVIPGPELGYDFDTKAELLGALLHTGNESNLKKLLLGRGWASIKEDGTLDTSRWDRFISRLRQEGVLTKVDYDYAQGVWDLFEEIKGPLQKAWKAVYGFYFKEIKAKSFKTPFGEYRGGYVPATPDSILSAKAEQRNEKESIMQTNSSFSFPSTSRSMTKARNDKVAVPLLMDLRMVTQHIDAVLRLAYIQPAVNQVYSLINRGDFRDVLDSSNRAIMSGMLIPWLKRAVTQSVTTPATSRAGKIVDRVSTILRKRTGMSTMILNIPNIIQQYTGISIAATKVRRSLLNAALITYSRQPTDTHANMVEKSLFMRQNTDLQMTEISNQIEDLVLNPNKFQKVVNFGERNGYVLQQITQNQVNVVVWTAAYTQYLEEHNDDLNAVRFADSVIRETQGSFNPESISESESGRAFYRVFTMFYSYFNMQANLLTTEASKIVNEVGWKDGAPQLFYLYVVGLMIPAVLADAIFQAFSGELTDDEDDDGYLNDFLAMFFGSQYKTVTAMVPGGSIINAFTQFDKRYNSDKISVSPVVGAVENTAKAIPSVYKAVVEDGKAKPAIKNSLTAIQIISGLPVAPLGRPLGYLAEVSEGNEQPSGPVDFTRGLISGKSKPKD